MSAEMVLLVGLSGMVASGLGTLAFIEGRCVSARLGGFVVLALGVALLFVATKADKLL